MLASSLSLQVYVLLCGAKNLTKNFSILCIELILKSNARLAKEGAKKAFPTLPCCNVSNSNKTPQFLSNSFKKSRGASVV